MKHARNRLADNVFRPKSATGIRDHDADDLPDQQVVTWSAVVAGTRTGAGTRRFEEILSGPHVPRHELPNTTTGLEESA
ncbi:hypothetical protein AB0I53_30810 [Saccharopolyspora sp. NPDC050389]|uniref:hypothetical protein n=1 Tax=Saccharopolyspora sp. NPDC050389 TaxID=3155516 RepID=UPI0033D418F0